MTKEAKRLPMLIVTTLAVQTDCSALRTGPAALRAYAVSSAALLKKRWALSRESYAIYAETTTLVFILMNCGLFFFLEPSASFLIMGRALRRHQLPARRG